MVLYSRADTGLECGESRESDRRLRSLGRIFRLSIYGLSQPMRGLMKKTPPKERQRATNGAVLLLLVMVGAATLAAQTMLVPSAAAPARPATVYTRVKPAVGPSTPMVEGGLQAAPGTFDNLLTLADIGVSDPTVPRAGEPYHTDSLPVP